MFSPYVRGGQLLSSLSGPWEWLMNLGSSSVLLCLLYSGLDHLLLGWDPCWKWMILDSSFLIGLSSLHLMSGLSTLGPLGPVLGADSPGILIVFWNSRVVTIFAGEPLPKFS